MLTLQDDGALAFLKARFNNVWPSSKNLTLRLFVNNVTPTDTHTTASYTEATGGGYAAIALTVGSWTVSIVGGIAQAAYALQSFVFTGALTTNPTVYGYYVTDGDGILQFSELLLAGDGTTPAPFTPASNTDHVDITPIFKLSKGTPS